MASPSDTDVRRETGPLVSSLRHNRSERRCLIAPAARQQTPITGWRNRRECPPRVAGGMPPRYVPRVNDERNVRAACELSHLRHMPLMRRVWFSGRSRARTTTRWTSRSAVYIARENMKAFSRVLVAIVAALAALFVSTGTSHAGLDNELSLVDGQDRTLTIQQWDTFLNGVFPLDRNRLTREWFHSGSAVYNVAGPGADSFAGTLELGYQIGFPWSLGVGINFSYTTPNILIDDAPLLNPLSSVITPNLFPGVSISADMGNGPGIQEVA